MSSSAVLSPVPVSDADPGASRMAASPRSPELVRPHARFPRRVDLAALERQLREAFAALAANRPYPEPGGDADRQIQMQARILRLLFTCGAQPAIDISAMSWKSSGHPSQAVATTIGCEAGCRDRWAVAACLEALCAAGLVRFARRRLVDPRRYAVIEEEPEIATRSAPARQLHPRGTLCLTSLADALCRRCASG